MELQKEKGGRAAIVAAVATAVCLGGLAVGALADHFNANNVPKGWTSTKTEGQTVCYNGCSGNVVGCTEKSATTTQTTGGTITYHPKGEGGKNNPHVFAVSLPDGPKIGPSGNSCPN